MKKNKKAVKSVKTKMSKETALELAGKLVDSPVFMGAYVGEKVFYRDSKAYYSLKTAALNMLGIPSLARKLIGVAFIAGRKKNATDREIGVFIKSVEEAIRKFQAIDLKISGGESPGMEHHPVSNKVTVISRKTYDLNKKTGQSIRKIIESQKSCKYQDVPEISEI